MGAKSRQIALGGVISALCVAVMFLAGIIPLTQYTLPMTAGGLIMLMAVEIGNKPAICAWVSVSVLSLIIVPDRYTALMFTLFFGYYPIAKQKLERLPSRMVEYACKLLLFNVSAVASLFVLIFIFGAAQALEGVGEFAGFNPLLVLILGNVLLGSVMFIVYDLLLTRCYTLYIDRYRQKFFGGVKWGS